MNILKILAAGILFLLPSQVNAQIEADGSTSTTIDNNGNVSTIDAGDKSGSNLFHSFDRFSVPNGNEAFFNNAADIDNIFSRVTGGSVSNIDGLIRANNANLFLINPAGVIFGSGARVDLGGAFYGGSADSILFPDDVEFSASNTTAPILTINAPIGLNFRNEPAGVSVQSNSLSTAGQDINLFGGNISFENGTVNAVGNRVSLGAVSAAGTVILNENLDFSNVSLADITFDNSQINVNGAGGGEIAIDARNLTLSNSSSFSAGINSDSSNSQTQAGDININVTETVTLDSESVIRNNLSQTSSGNAGNIFISAQNLSLADNSRLSTITAGNGNAGNIDLDIAETTTLNQTAEIKSEISQTGVGNAGNIDLTSGSISLNNNSQLLADVKGEGDGGNIIITTDTLDLTRSNFSTNLSGQGSAGSIEVIASDSILLEGSTFQSQVLENAVGSAGSIEIDTESLVLSNDIDNPSESSRILASTAGTGNGGNININVDTDITPSTAVSVDNDSSIQTQVKATGVGDAGDIVINTTDLSLTNGTKFLSSSLLTNSVGEGKGGDITINALGNINLDTYGLILTQGTAGTGDAGNIDINSDTLSLSTASTIISTTGDTRNSDIPNSGNAGNININSRIITLDTFSGITSSSPRNAVGQAGNIILNTDNLTVAGGTGISAFTGNDSDGGTIEVNANNLDIFTGGVIATLTNGAGNAGDIILNLERQLTIDGANPLIPPEQFRSPLLVDRQLETETGLFANTTEISTGNGGNVQITTPETVIISNGGKIAVDSEGSGNGGVLTINAGALELNNRSQLIAETQQSQPEQESSTINLQIDNNLTLRGDSRISARAFNNADGGNVNIDAEFVIAFTPGEEGNDIIANAQEGSGGEINITAQEIFGLQEGVAETANASNDIDVSSEFGFDGSISINTPDVSSKTAIRDLPVNTIAPGENVQQACSASSAVGLSSLSLQGRGGIPSPPTNTLSSDNILFDGELSEANRIEKSDRIEDSAIATSQGKIYPARGVLLSQTGDVILTRSSNNHNSDFKSDRVSSCLIN